MHGTTILCQLCDITTVSCLKDLLEQFLSCVLDLQNFEVALLIVAIYSLNFLSTVATVLMLMCHGVVRHSISLDVVKVGGGGRGHKEPVCFTSRHDTTEKTRTCFQR